MISYSWAMMPKKRKGTQAPKVPNDDYEVWQDAADTVRRSHHGF